MQNYPLCGILFGMGLVVKLNSKSTILHFVFLRKFTDQAFSSSLPTPPRVEHKRHPGYTSAQYNNCRYHSRSAPVPGAATFAQMPDPESMRGPRPIVRIHVPALRPSFPATPTRPRIPTAA